jgi:hypothetical protein
MAAPAVIHWAHLTLTASPGTPAEGMVQAVEVVVVQVETGTRPAAAEATVALA